MKIADLHNKNPHLFYTRSNYSIISFFQKDTAEIKMRILRNDPVPNPHLNSKVKTLHIVFVCRRQQHRQRT